MKSYRKISTSLLKSLPERTSDVLKRRFGLDSGEGETLEAIGQDYGITRERVRQIENEGFSQVKEKKDKYSDVFKEFDKTLESVGGFKREDLLLSDLGKEKYQNEASFLLNLKEDAEKVPESENFYSFWIKEDKEKKNVEKTAKLAAQDLNKKGELMSLDQLYSSLKGKIDVGKKGLQSSLEISKNIDKDAGGKYGLVNWVEVSPKGVKDKAYLVLKNEKNPLHFSDIASAIEKSPFLGGKSVHTATVHNELIKNSRFVLVGRGMYALREWGYEPGVVKDIIRKVLKEADKPLKKEEVLAKVSKQRLVKPNTVFLNLHDRKRFERDSEGRYTVRES